MKKNNITLSEVKKFLKKKGLVILSKNSIRLSLDNSFKNFYYTALCSLVLIMFFYTLPIFINLKDNVAFKAKEVQNKSKEKLERVLKKKDSDANNESIDVLNSAEVFEDVFKFDDLPSDTVRLSASTIQQLFKDTNYNLRNVRKNKVVKPRFLSLLPNEMKMIESTKERKNLFIQIILPLILEENNQIKIDRKKLFSILNKKSNSNLEKRWLDKKFRQYGVKNKDFLTLKIRMDEVPVSLAIAQAAKETGWGTSRFALEGNALFGQWTYSGAGITPLNAESDQTHKVMKFKILKASIRAYQRNLNTHSSYKDFRKARSELRGNDEKLDSMILADYLDKYAETGEEYTKIIKQIIKQNELRDFDDVRLLPTKIKLKNLI